MVSWALHASGLQLVEDILHVLPTCKRIASAHAIIAAGGRPGSGTGITTGASVMSAVVALQAQDQLIKRFPEVGTVFGKIGE